MNERSDNGPSPGSRILVAMSGGVDSSVAACLLREQGYDVMGLFMRVGADPPPDEACPNDAPHPVANVGSPGRTHQGCCSAADAADARFVAGQLGIPFYALNFQADFDRIIDYFADEYVHGRTPNPCVKCNNWLKFGKLVDYADALGADFVATGHYAQVERVGSSVRLRRGADRRKDQSYFLYGIEPAMLARALFPVGHLDKDEVRALAERFGLPVTDKPDSVEICFVPDRDYARVVRERRPEAFRAGTVVDAAGHELGRHDGIAHFTIGQRRGLGIATGKPAYVTQLNVLTNTVTLGSRDDLLSTGLLAGDVNRFVDFSTGRRCAAKIRYQHSPAACVAQTTPDGRLRVNFDEPQSAVTPGQSVVLYDDDVVIGGGTIIAATGASARPVQAPAENEG